MTILKETIRTWTEDPRLAQGHPSVTARSDGAGAVIEAGPFSWRADLPAALGGSNESPSPTALLLGALAGCAVVFIKDTLAPLLGVAVTSVDATASCATDARGLLGIGDAAPDLSSLSLDIKIDTADGDAARQRLLDLWQERCPIYLALVRPTAVRLNGKIEP
jgi:uncharacterized OsmC-like protein